MASDDLNECVSALLRKEKYAIKSLKKVIRYTAPGTSKQKRRRFRKDKSQFDLLQRMYNKN